MQNMSASLDGAFLAHVQPKVGADGNGPITFIPSETNVHPRVICFHRHSYTHGTHMIQPYSGTHIPHLYPQVRGAINGAGQRGSSAAQHNPEQ